MKGVVYLRTAAILCTFLMSSVLRSQEIASQERDFFKEFKELEGGEERAKFFFDTQNRYAKNSAYDWLDTVNVYLTSSQKTNDSSAVVDYQLIQSQIYYDLGDYEKSLAIAKDLFEAMDGYDIEKKERILNLMDDDYSKLELYD